MPAPPWFWRFMYDRESEAWARRRDQPAHRALVEEAVDELAELVAPPGPVADLGCGPGAHALALAHRGYEVVGLDASPRMVAVAQSRAIQVGVEASFAVHDVGASLPFADRSLGGALGVLVLQHLPDPARFVAEVRRCLRPGGHVLLTAPTRDGGSPRTQSRYWRWRAACYQRVPGLVRFAEPTALRRLVEDHGFDVVACRDEPARVHLVARRPPT